jgi:hypothetical protein
METLVLMPTEFGLAPTPKSGHLSQDADACRLAVHTEQYVAKGTRFLPFEGTVRLGRFHLEPFLPEHDVSNIFVVELSRQVLYVGNLRIILKIMNALIHYFIIYMHTDLI